MGGFYRKRTSGGWHRTTQGLCCPWSSVSVCARPCSPPLPPGPAALAHLLEHQRLLARGVGDPELAREQPELPLAHLLAQGQGLHAVARVLGGAGPAFAG